MQASLFQHKPQQIDLVTGARIGRTSKSIWFLFPKFNEPRTPESHVFPWNKKVAYLKLFGVLFPFSGPLGSIPICQLWTAQVLITAWANEPAKWKPMWEEPVWYQFWTISAIPIKCFFLWGMVRPLFKYPDLKTWIWEWHHRQENLAFSSLEPRVQLEHGPGIGWCFNPVGVWSSKHETTKKLSFGHKHDEAVHNGRYDSQESGSAKITNAWFHMV